LNDRLPILLTNHFQHQSSSTKVAAFTAQVHLLQQIY